MRETSNALKMQRRKYLHSLANDVTTFPVKRRTYRRDEVIEMLKKRQGARSLRQFAIELGISAPYLSDIYNGNRPPGKSVLQQLGLTKVAVQVDPMYQTAS